MFIPFQDLPSDSRVWVFQCNRPLSPAELKVAESTLMAFTEGWTVHGSPFNTSFLIKYNQFIILAADETSQSASGCSIDNSVRVLKELEQELGVELFDRNQIAFQLAGKVVLVPLQNVKQKFMDGTLNEGSLSFNNLVGTKKELEEKWLLPAGQTWLNRYIPNPLAKVK